MTKSSIPFAMFNTPDFNYMSTVRFVPFHAPNLNCIRYPQNSFYTRA